MENSQKNKECNNLKKNEIAILSLLKYSIKNGTVIPFYQGMLNNSNSKIDKYEALMRIVDSEGNIYFPSTFIPISIKHNLYNKISQMMIEQVFQDFHNRNECISINISLYDILSSKFRAWFINKLETFNNPSRITIEFLETEKYADNSILLNFVRQLKKLGCKIAVDDFGVGYANMQAIIKLKPDFLKIDGSIIKNLDTDKDSLTLLEFIHYFSSKIKVSLIAEFVENKSIQDVLLKYNIDYSQGYYFSRPSPFLTLN